MSQKMVFNNLTQEAIEVFSAIQKRKISGKEELILETGIKSTTMNRILERLKDEGLILVCGEGESTGGRRPLLYGINNENRIYYVGVNIGFYHLDVSILHYSGRVESLLKKPYPLNAGPEQALTDIRTMYETALRKTGIDPKDIYGCGLCIFCSLDRAQGVVLKSVSAENLNPEWFGFPIKQRVGEIFGMEPVMETSINSVCIGEYCFGNGRNFNKMSVLLCSNAIRMGCMQNGMLIRPANNIVDAFGHMVIEVGGRPCRCGNYGCVGTYGSASAIVRTFRHELRSGRSSSLIEVPVEDLTVYDILHAGEDGDQLAVEVITKAATMVGMATANYINLTNPEILICAGLLMENSSVYYEAVKETVARITQLLQGKNNLLFMPRTSMGKSAVGAAITAMEAQMGKSY